MSTVGRHQSRNIPLLPLTGHEPSHRTQQFLEFDRFHKAGPGTEFARLLSCRTTSGQYDDGYRRERACAERLQELFTVHARHHQIEKDQSRPIAVREVLPGIDSIGSDIDAIVMGFKNELENLADIMIVINDQD
jgi:hypothetical protein